MKTTNLIKKAAGLILAFVTASTLTMPTFALATEPDIQSRASGNGWVTTAIVKNGVSYVLNGGIGLDSSHRATTGLNTSCKCTREHGVVTMVYLAEGDGNITVTSPRSCLYVGATGLSRSLEAVPSTRYGAFQDYVQITGTITVTVTNQDGSTNHASLSPKLTR